MTNRPSGTSSNNFIETVMAQMCGAERRAVITGKIRGQTGLPRADAERPSAHLRWALQQMKTRGWRNDDWGTLLEDDGETLGDGPICLLEAIHAPVDAPGNVDCEGPEQFYVRSAFVALGWPPACYLSEWNDAQETFEPIEAVLLKAIELAEADERDDVQPWKDTSREELYAKFGITAELLDEVKARQDAELADQK